MSALGRGVGDVSQKGAFPVPCHRTPHNHFFFVWNGHVLLIHGWSSGADQWSRRHTPVFESYSFIHLRMQGPDATLYGGGVEARFNLIVLASRAVFLRIPGLWPV